MFLHPIDPVPSSDPISDGRRDNQSVLPLELFLEADLHAAEIQRPAIVRTVTNRIEVDRRWKYRIFIISFLLVASVAGGVEQIKNAASMLRSTSVGECETRDARTNETRFQPPIWSHRRRDSRGSP